MFGWPTRRSRWAARPRLILSGLRQDPRRGSQVRANAIHPGYGFPGSTDFAQAVTDAGHSLDRPQPQSIRGLGDKVWPSHRGPALRAPLVPST